MGEGGALAPVTAPRAVRRYPEKCLLWGCWAHVPQMAFEFNAAVATARRPTPYTVSFLEAWVLSMGDGSGGTRYMAMEVRDCRTESHCLTASMGQ